MLDSIYEPKTNRRSQKNVSWGIQWTYWCCSSQIFKVSVSHLQKQKLFDLQLIADLSDGSPDLIEVDILGFPEERRFV